MRKMTHKWNLLWEAKFVPREKDDFFRLWTRILTDGKIKDQAPVVQKLDSAIHRINHYPVD